MDNHSALLLERYRKGDEEAAEELFTRYLERLTSLARTHLSEKLSRRVDPEDIVLSAYRSFFINVRKGRFTLQNSGDLWRLLAQITMNKLYRKVAHHTAQKRSVHQEVDVNIGDTNSDLFFDKQPTPEEAVALVDEVEAILKSLSPTDRVVFENRLEGATHTELALKLNCSEKTISRILLRIQSKLTRDIQQADDNYFIVPKVNVRSANRYSLQKQQQNKAYQIDKTVTYSYSDFTLKQLVGMGGVGKVYRAESNKGKQVAIKFLKKSMLEKPYVVERFIAEARLIEKLNHPHLVKINGLGKTPNGGYFIVMDFIQGKNLAEIAASESLLSTKQIVKWMTETATVLHFVHQQGIVHCDLKPENILIDNNGIARLTDFGFARSLSEGEQGLHVGLAGTAAYMAPEQIDSFWGEVSPRTDVYGLGAVLFQLLTGSPLFPGQQISEIFSQIITMNAKLLEDKFPNEVSKSLRDVCVCCLNKQPMDRYASAEIFKKAISDCIEH